MIGYFAAASGAARVLGLGADATLSALGLSLMQAAGTKQVMIEGDAPAKGLYGGFSCLGGVLAAVLAAGGVDGRMSVLEGEAGLMGVFFDLGEAALVSLDGLGEQWSAAEVALKRWPASGVVQPYIEAALALRERTPVDPESVAGVQLVARSGQRDWFEPTADRLNPGNAAAAGNSVAFGVACALDHGGLRIEDLAVPLEGGVPGRLGGEQVARLLARTEHRFDGDPAVTVLLADGTRHTERCAARATNLDDAGLAEKLVAANRLASAPRSAEELTRLTTALDELESLPDVRGILRFGGGAARPLSGNPPLGSRRNPLTRHRPGSSFLAPLRSLPSSP